MLHTLHHPSGISASIHPLGATLRSLKLPDRNNRFENILTGFQNEHEWLKNDPHFGCTIGRYANRIANGQFTLNGTHYQLPQNQGNHHLHGGFKGFSEVVWETEILSHQHVRFSYLSPDGEEGYPGNLQLSIDYILSENSLTWKATATTDQPTPINLTCHPYFNLSGNPKTSILNHLLQINAASYLPVDETQIPTGEICPVANSGFDFQSPTTIGDNLKKAAQSFDHNFILEKTPNSIAARCTDPSSGRHMEIITDQPGLQLYLASPLGHENSAFCLEPQNFPNSPNHPHFPNSILHPGETYSRFITFSFPK